MSSRPPLIDVRPYRWMIAALGLLLLLAFSIDRLTSRGSGGPGVAAGQRLHYFSAPLANSTLVGDANLNPPCTAADHDPRALNICLLAQRTPLVLGFFVTDSSNCKLEIDTLQAVATDFPSSKVQFAAVAIRASRSQTLAAVRAHHWTIPVAYDRDGAVGALYGVQICPMVELARRGGVVADRLIGDHWLGAPALASRIRSLLAR